MLEHNPWWRPSSVRLGSVPYIVLITALLACGAAAWAFRGAVESRDDARFRASIRVMQERIENRLDRYIGMLNATRGMFVASGGDVDAVRFQRFVDQLEIAERYPGIQGIGFTQRFHRSDRGELEGRMRARGVRGFEVWPVNGDEELHAILFLEPKDRRNLASIGFDMSTDEVRLEAMRRARDTGRPAASAAVTLAPELDGPGEQRAFLIFVPVYRGGDPPATVEQRREQLLGFVFSAFRIDDLLAGILGNDQMHRLEMAVHDGPSESALLLHQSAESGDDEPRFTTATHLEIAGRTWTVRWHSTDFLEHGSTTWLWPYVVGVGLLISALLFLLSLAQAKRHEQLRLQAQILDSMREGVSVSDERGNLLYTNPSEDEMFGYERGELIGAQVAALNRYPPEQNQQIVDGIIRDLRRDGVWAGEFENVKKDGTPFVTIARISALQARGRSYWVCVQQDISAEKRAEQERTVLLEREKEMRAAAETASRAKDEFLAMLGHELRNPLAPIVTALELVEARSDVLPKEYQIIERQVAHLRRLVDDLLDVSAITRGKVVLLKKHVEVSHVIGMALEAVSPLFDERKHQLVVEAPARGLVVDADEARLAQIFINLLTNAAKYTDPGGRVEITASREGDQVVTRVRDNGIGLAPEVQPHLFEAFVQGERRVDRARGGLGLGLTLVRSLVQLHGGTVEAQSEGPGQGSEFVVRLPAAVPRPREAPAAGAIGPGLPHATTPRHVLLVDDNADAADLLAEFLRAAGHEVAVAYDAEQALELAHHGQTDVAILDIGLPIMDGYELAARLPKQPRPLLIAVTGYGREDDLAKSSAAGFDHHFVKPVSPLRILEALDEHT